MTIQVRQAQLLDQHELATIQRNLMRVGTRCVSGRLSPEADGSDPARRGADEAPKEIPSWDSQTPDQRKIEARQMETFAGFATHTDEQIGRLTDALQEMGVMDNTLLIYIVGDNGASAEGGPEGAYNEMMALNGIINTAAINMPHLDEWGGQTPSPTMPSAGPGLATLRFNGPSR